MIRIHSKDGEPVEIEAHKDAIYSIAVNAIVRSSNQISNQIKGDKFATASEDKTVVCLRFSDQKVDKEMFKFPGPARSVAFSSKGFVSAGGE